MTSCSLLKISSHSMGALVVSLLMLLASAGLFFFYIEDAYARWQRSSAELDQVETVLRQYNEFEERRRTVIAQRTALLEETARVTKLLPDHVDMVRLILDIEAIASNHDKVTVSGFSFSTGADATVASEERGVLYEQPSGEEQGTAAGKRYGEATISFKVVGPYDAALAFLRDIERSLRLLDVVSLSVSRGGANVNGSNSEDAPSYTFAIEARTYWLP